MDMRPRSRAAHGQCIRLQDLLHSMIMRWHHVMTQKVSFDDTWFVMSSACRAPSKETSCCACEVISGSKWSER